MTKRNSIYLTISIAAITGVFLLVPEVASAAQCGGAETALLDCGNATGKDAIFAILKQVIRILTALIGVAAVGAVVYGGVLYSSSGDVPENVKKAKNIWMNTVIGLLLYAFFAAILTFLIPGGVF